MKTSEPSPEQPEADAPAPGHTGDFGFSWRPSALRGLPAASGLRGGHGVAVVAGTAALVLTVVVGGVLAAWAASSGGDSRTKGTIQAVPAGGQVGSTPLEWVSAGPSPTKGAALGQKTTSGQQNSPTQPTAGPKPGSTAKAKPTSGSPKVSVAATGKKASGLTVTKKKQFKNLVTGYCMDLAPHGTAQTDTQFTQNSCSSSSSQQFDLVKKSGQFLIRDVKSPYCLNVWGTESVNPGENVTAYDCVLGAADNMMFKTQAQGAGVYIIHVKSGLCLDISNAGAGNSAVDAGLTLFTCSPDDDHIWQIS